MLWQRLQSRLRTAVLTVPSSQDWLYAIGLLLLYGLVYLPIGLGGGFLRIDVQQDWVTILKIAVTAFVMPGVLEELIFRALLIPHPTEPISTQRRWFYVGLSWLLFVLYHLHPFVPLFFRTPAFLVGAGWLGMICTAAYLKSGSLWVPAVIHWLIVTVWFLIFGGLGRFQGLG